MKSDFCSLVRPGLAPAMPAGEGRRHDRPTRPSATTAAPGVYYGAIEYRGFLLNVFGTPEGWNVAVMKTGYPFRELHAATEATMEAAIDLAKRWVDRPELREPAHRASG